MTKKLLVITADFGPYEQLCLVTSRVIINNDGIRYSWLLIFGGNVIFSALHMQSV